MKRMIDNVDIVPGALIVSKNNHFTLVVVGVEVPGPNTRLKVAMLSVVVSARGGGYSSGYFHRWCHMPTMLRLAEKGEVLIVGSLL